MTVDIELYTASKHKVILWFNTKGGKEIQRTISMMASAYHIPAIVIAYWLGEETNWHPDTIKAVQRLTDFYGYSDIKGKPPGAPI